MRIRLGAAAIFLFATGGAVACVDAEAPVASGGDPTAPPLDDVLARRALSAGESADLGDSSPLVPGCEMGSTTTFSYQHPCTLQLTVPPSVPAGGMLEVVVSTRTGDPACTGFTPVRIGASHAVRAWIDGAEAPMSATPPVIPAGLCNASGVQPIPTAPFYTVELFAPLDTPKTVTFEIGTAAASCQDCVHPGGAYACPGAGAVPSVLGPAVVHARNPSVSPDGSTTKPGFASVVFFDIADPVAPDTCGCPEPSPAAQDAGVACDCKDVMLPATTFEFSRGWPRPPKEAWEIKLPKVNQSFGFGLSVKGSVSAESPSCTNDCKGTSDTSVSGDATVKLGTDAYSLGLAGSWKAERHYCMECSDESCAMECTEMTCQKDEFTIEGTGGWAREIAAPSFYVKAGLAEFAAYCKVKAEVQISGKYQEKLQIPGPGTDTCEPCASCTDSSKGGGFKIAGKGGCEGLLVVGGTSLDVGCEECAEVYGQFEAALEESDCEGSKTSTGGDLKVSAGFKLRHPSRCVKARFFNVLLRGEVTIEGSVTQNILTGARVLDGKVEPKFVIQPDPAPVDCITVNP